MKTFILILVAVALTFGCAEYNHATGPDHSVPPRGWKVACDGEGHFCPIEMIRPDLYSTNGLIRDWSVSSTRERCIEEIWNTVEWRKHHLEPPHYGSFHSCD